MKRSFIRILSAAAILLTLFIVCVSCGASGKSDGSLTVTFLDVGKGDCILLRKDGHAVLIDAGYDSSVEEVLAFLQKAGVKRLDVFVITHYDKDHVGGAAGIAAGIAVDKLYLPGYEGKSEYYTALMSVISRKSIPAETVTEDLSFELAGMSFELFASKLEYDPDKGDEGNDNDVSLVMTVRWGEDSYLFAGDIEKDGIKSWLSTDPGTFDVVKMPHHGRKEGNTDDFIASTQPKIAIITDSDDEEADDKVVSWLEEAGAAVYRSAECGNIVLKSTGTGEYTVTSEKTA